MTNLPNKVMPEHIMDFFSEISVLTMNDIVIEQKGGQFSGRALVIFENEDFV